MFRWGRLRGQGRQSGGPAAGTREPAHTRTGKSGVTECGAWRVRSHRGRVVESGITTRPVCTLSGSAVAGDRAHPPPSTSEDSGVPNPAHLRTTDSRKPSGATCCPVLRTPPLWRGHRPEPRVRGDTGERGPAPGFSVRCSCVTPGAQTRTWVLCAARSKPGASRLCSRVLLPHRRGRTGHLGRAAPPLPGGGGGRRRRVVWAGRALGREDAGTRLLALRATLRTALHSVSLGGQGSPFPHPHKAVGDCSRRSSAATLHLRRTCLLGHRLEAPSLAPQGVCGLALRHPDASTGPRRVAAARVQSRVRGGSLLPLSHVDASPAPARKAGAWFPHLSEPIRERPSPGHATKAQETVRFEEGQASYPAWSPRCVTFAAGPEGSEGSAVSPSAGEK